MKKYKTGLIVGKFSPLHKGHEFAIHTAQDACDKLYIITYSNPEFAGCSADRRKYWLKSIFPPATILALNNNLPDNDDTDESHRKFVSEICRDVLIIAPDAVFSSENYGPGFAEYLGTFFRKEVEHVYVDLDRKQFPISGSKLRSDIHANQVYLSSVVYADFIKTICFLGAESTGKSTLTMAAAHDYNTASVAEYGRTLWEEKKGKLLFDDMVKIAHTHIADEDKLRLKANRFLFVDTSPLTTMFYSEYLFSKVAPELNQLSKRKYDYIFLCEPDFPLVQDGTRLGKEFRTKQQEWYIKILNERNIKFYNLCGNIDKRLKSIEEILNA